MTETTSKIPSDAAEEPLLSVRDLQTYFRTEAGIAKAVDGVSFDVRRNEVLGIVGESGSGKSVCAQSILRLIPNPPGFFAGGEILFDGKDLLAIPHTELRRVRGGDIGMVFQEPMTALNPLHRIGQQVSEPIHAHENVSRKAARERAAEMLNCVGIPDAKRRLGDYPHQFSGGMRQRVVIAMALVCNPVLLIADEPTTALDVTTQAQILDLVLELRAQHEGGSVILITHDLAVIAETCQRVVVMYGGKVQEIGGVEQIFDDPRHPYTQGLLASLPDHAERSHRLQTIPGNVPAILELPAGCKFCTRCPDVFDRCLAEEPPMHDLGDGSFVRCHLVEEQSPNTEDAA